MNTRDGNRGRVARLTVEHVAARALIESETLSDAAGRVLRAICEGLGWDYGALWNVEVEQGTLRCVETCHLPSAHVPEFEAASRGRTFARGVGLPGRVWECGEPVWIRDVTADKNFPRANIALRDGLHAAFALPILGRGSLVGVMEFFSREIRQPDEELLQMLSIVGAQIGRFMERKRAEEELDRFFTLSLDLLCIAGFDGYFKRLNPAWERALGYTLDELLARPYVDFVHPDDRSVTRNEAARAQEGLNVLAFENRYLHKNGTYRWLEWFAVPYPREQVTYAAARDITDRKEATETIQRYSRDLAA